MFSLKFVAWSLLVITILAQCPNSNSHGGHDHGHSHDHGHDHFHDHVEEAPSFKYSKQANIPPPNAPEATEEPEHYHDNGHSHDHDHDHSHDLHDHGHGHSHDHIEEPPSLKYSKQANVPPPTASPSTVAPRSQASIWIKSIISIFAISCGPLIVLFFIRVDNSDSHKTALEYLLSFASGGLLGDALLHLIPHALIGIDVSHSTTGHDYTYSANSHGHSHGDDAVHAAHIGVGAWVLSGILAFLLVEVLMRAIRRRSDLSRGHSHDVNTEETVAEPTTHSDAVKGVSDSPIAAPPQKKSKSETAIEDSETTTHRRRTNSRNRSQPQSEQEAKSSGHISKKHKADDSGSGSEDKGDRSPSPDDEHPEHSSCIQETQGMCVAGYLNLAADFSHNFTDGLAIGAGFLVGDGIGILTAITVIIHEIPHEIGDYAILVKSGCSSWKAIGLQLVTAIGALLGAILALGLGATSGAVAWILPFTAGGFIYIATVSVLPELLESKATLFQAVCQLVFLMVGVGLMALVILFE